MRDGRAGVSAAEDLSGGWETLQPQVEIGARTAEYELPDIPASPGSARLEAGSELLAARSAGSQLPPTAFVGYDTTEVYQGMTEVLAYGTAVVVEPEVAGGSR